ncbi:MAG: RHS repeat-associated core domain-containing protein [Kiritimatiellae bacterium]|nr:RHS repeat-associated core domain-containing protein [Kiritimatiellia bacterium]
MRYTYDSQNRRTSLSTTRDGVTWDTTTWTYDAATGNCLSKTYADNSTVTYTYTPDNLPLRTTYASGRWKENVYDDRCDAGYAIAFSGGGTFVRSVTHDPYRREIVTDITNAFGGVSYGLAYGHDALARPVARNDDTFAYNTRGEVESAIVDGNAETHGYDFIGNSLLATFNSVTNIYTANSLNQYVSILRASASTHEISHDADGNMTNDGVFTYTYDSASRLTTVSSNGIILVTNLYDCRGRRVRKITQTATYTFFYDGWNLIYEHVANTNGTVESFQYFWGRDLSGSLQGAGGVGGLLYVKRSGTIYVPHADAMGNILRYTDTAGNVVAAYTYDAFGKTISAIGSLAHLFRHRFSTKYYDVETGLYYFGYRFCSPSLKRWLNRDPIEEEGGVNLYGFCRNNAITSFDNDGRAYFAYRPLDNPVTLNTGIMGASSKFMQKRNWVIAHEQLIFEDGDSPVNIGYFNAPIGENNPRQDEFYFQTQMCQ